jgi:hypothetical protein
MAVIIHEFEVVAEPEAAEEDAGVPPERAERRTPMAPMHQQDVLQWFLEREERLRAD